MYHLNLPYQEMCDSDYYSIYTEVGEKGIHGREMTNERKDIETVM